MGSREEFDLTEGIVGVKDSDPESAKYWQSFGAAICVIKHGKEGSTAYTNDGKFYSIKPFPAVKLKGFGGGDGYGSSFLYSLLQGKEIIECLEFGSASASILISAHSCSDAMPSATQVEEFIKRVKKNTVKWWQEYNIFYIRFGRTETLRPLNKCILHRDF